MAPLGLTPESPPNIRWEHGCGGDAEAIVRKAMDIAADICVYTNRNVTIEKL